MCDLLKLEPLGGPFVRDADTGVTFLAWQADGGTRCQTPKTWAIAPIETLENLMLRAAVDAGVIEWVEDDDE
jgi:hypothetical protein